MSCHTAEPRVAAAGGVNCKLPVPECPAALLTTLASGFWDSPAGRIWNRTSVLNKIQATLGTLPATKPRSSMCIARR
jgi:hypothetical protein